MDDYFESYEPYDGDDLEALGQQESWEHSMAEREDMASYDQDTPLAEEYGGE